MKLLRKTHLPLLFAATIVFMVTLFLTHLAITFATPEQMGYSTPSSALPNSSSPDVGGEAFAEDNWVGVFLGPAPGDTDVPRDTVICVFETRPVGVDLHLTPETPVLRVTEEWDFLSVTKTMYPKGLLQPGTTYNVSGTIMGLPAWWTFKTGLEPAQPRMERLLSPNIWWIAVGAAILTTSAFTLAVTPRRKRNSKHLSESP